jgi:hypothetical protein
MTNISLRDAESLSVEYGAGNCDIEHERSANADASDKIRYFVRSVSVVVVNLRPPMKIAPAAPAAQNK